MTSLADTELLRARWRRELEKQALDTVDRVDFALGGLSARLRTPSVRLLLLPADPEANVVDVDEWFSAWAKNFQTVEIEGRSLHLGNQVRPTAHAAVLVDSHGSGEPWTSYLAVHRSGAIEYGLGDRGAWERNDSEGNLVRVFNLVAIVARSWAMLKFASALRDRSAPPGPYQLTIALHRSGGALLGNLGEGWAEPMSHENNVGGCESAHLVWHLELDDWPDGDGARSLAFQIGDRIEDAWGVSERRYLAHRGDRAGRLDVGGLRD